jgi:hypothetical protein
LPFRVAIADGGLEIDAKIKKEADVDNLIQILQGAVRDVVGIEGGVVSGC